MTISELIKQYGFETVIRAARKVKVPIGAFVSAERIAAIIVSAQDLKTEIGECFNAETIKAEIDKEAESAQ